MFNTIQAAIELLESAHVSTDLVWKRHDCVEALKKLAKPSDPEVINAIKEALAQADQESDDLTIAYMSGVFDGKNKYAPQREWVGLTDEEKHDCYLRIDIWSRCYEMIEAKLREKNT